MPETGGKGRQSIIKEPGILVVAAIVKIAQPVGHAVAHLLRSDEFFQGSAVHEELAE
jgi:hypothetical protein